MINKRRPRRSAQQTSQTVIIVRETEAHGGYTEYGFNAVEQRARVTEYDVSGFIIEHGEMKMDDFFFLLEIEIARRKAEQK
jgi:hypothetical protein